MASRSDSFSGVAQRLVREGIPAVIGMQFEVSEDAARVFARELYRHLTKGTPVDISVSETRRAMFSEVMGVEWGSPVLYMRSRDGRLFDME
jgi:hypothetical protein